MSGQGVPITQEDAERMADNQEFEELMEKAEEELAGVLNLDADDIGEITLNEFEDEEKGAGDYDEDRTVNINGTPDMSSYPDHRRKTEVQGEAVYEEIAHILTTQDTYEDSHGDRRKRVEEFNFWEASANEMLGGISRWGDKWSLESSLERAEKDIPEIEVGVRPNFAVNVLSHFIGYSISQRANDEGYDPAELARMSYDDIYNEFEEDVEEIRHELADEYGIFVGLEGETVMRQDLEETPDEQIETKEPAVYVENENGVYGFGTFDSEYDNPDDFDWERKWHFFGEEPPEEILPQGYSESGS